ncbi:hypothetical protein D3C78_811460 [compost metagenome]
MEKHFNSFDNLEGKRLASSYYGLSQLSSRSVRNKKPPAGGGIKGLTTKTKPIELRCSGGVERNGLRWQTRTTV